MGRQTLGIPRIPRIPQLPALAAVRGFDLVVAGLLLAAAAPVLLLAALAIRLDSPGPILFRQIRVGQGGRPFEMLKLRTMIAGASPALHREHVRALLRDGAGRPWIGPAADARVTRLGRLLRATALDELPQLVNVLRGDMRLVGPRPALPYEVDLWADWHHRRLTVPPGITGLWQVAGRERSTFDEMVRLDLAYIAARSTWLDLSILLRTPWALLRSRCGAPRTVDPRRIEA
jgi:lipopolysaccharide/colanic/teichoic acid biosynthesis glycosyltransferase